ncbi:MAG: hypothetical protein LLG14_03335 [Nocardiaceae bacterium]|nr:hypothetical protein [Nocardiaceae bacterium]
MIRLPSAGASTGFAAGAVVAFYPNEFARGTLTECLVIWIFGTIGLLTTRRALGSWSVSRTAVCERPWATPAPSDFRSRGASWSDRPVALVILIRQAW